MNKPVGYDDIQVGGYARITPGGHGCDIIEVKETISAAGNKMLEVAFDTDKTDKQPEFYRQQFYADKAAGRDAKWRGIHRVVVDERTPYGNANLKRFCTAVEDSNKGFKVDWGNGFCKCFQGQKVGIVFREEDYTATDGQARTAVKPFRFCNYAEAEKQAVPERKRDTSTQPGYQQMSFSPSTDPRLAQEGFMQIQGDPLNDEGLPFH